jgi:hypothetical protein
MISHFYNISQHSFTITWISERGYITEKPLITHMCRESSLESSLLSHLAHDVLHLRLCLTVTNLLLPATRWFTEIFPCTFSTPCISCTWLLDDQAILFCSCHHSYACASLIFTVHSYQVIGLVHGYHTLYNYSWLWKYKMPGLKKWQ